MPIPIRCKGLCLAGVISLALAATAQAAAPASQEYLPKVPKAAGGFGAEAASAGTGTSAGSAAGAGSTEGKAGGQPKSAGASAPRINGFGRAGKLPAVAIPAASRTSSDDSSGLFDTIFDPVVMLIVAGVIAIAIGMTLVRRKSGDAEMKPGARGKPAMAPPTPEGEIVGGGERPI